MYVTLASLAAGVTVSAVRWAIIDHLHHATGIVPPAWKFANLEGKLQGYLTLIENHYRYYQFYSNMFVAAAFAYCGEGSSPKGRASTDRLAATRADSWPWNWFSSPAPETRCGNITAGLSSYSIPVTPNPRKEHCHDQRWPPQDVESVKKPVVKKQAPVAKPNSPRSGQTQGR